MTNCFTDKVVIVTGGASGIGKALCEELCRHRACVIIADIDEVQAQTVSGAIVATGGRAYVKQLDVTALDPFEKLVAETVAEYGQLDYIFNNAAATATRGEMRDIPIDPWHRAINVNLMGVVHGSIAALTVMAKQGFGHIVNIGSLAGLVGFPTSIPYGATKAAVVNLSVALRLEAAESGVKVSVVCPGPIHSDKPEPTRLIGTERAAQLILKGVSRNKAFIVFPMFARVMWWLYRLSPNIIFPIGRKMIRSYRIANMTGRQT